MTGDIFTSLDGGARASGKLVAGAGAGARTDAARAAPACSCLVCEALTRLGGRVPLRTQAMATRLEAMGARGQADQIEALAERGKRAPHEAPALRRRAMELSAAADTLDALARALDGGVR
jgi:hypothetical protein